MALLHCSFPYYYNTPTPTTTTHRQIFPLTPINTVITNSHSHFRTDELYLNKKKKQNTSVLVRYSEAAIATPLYDSDLRSVLELATDSELYELYRILYGPSYFSPLIKSVVNNDVEIDYSAIEDDVAERQAFIAALESRFLYLAADARSTLRGWKPSYRNVLLEVRRKLNIPCSKKLPTEDLEAEIFLYLLQDYSSEESGTIPDFDQLSEYPNDQGSLELGLRQWNGQAIAAVKLGLVELQSIILKGGGVFTLSKIYQSLASKLSGKVFLEAANYQIKKEVIKKGGQLAVINLESRVALLAAKQGLAGAASRYLGFRSMLSLLGPVLWGTFLADVVIQMLGTDYARILRAIYAFAKIRITRTYRLPPDID